MADVSELSEPSQPRSLATTTGDLSEPSGSSAGYTANSPESSKLSAANKVSLDVERNAVDLDAVATNTDRCWVKMDTDTKWADAGDGLFATKDICQGQLILRELPEKEIELRPGLGLDGEEDLLDKALFSEAIVTRDGFLTTVEKTILGKNSRCLFVHRPRSFPSLDGEGDQELDILLVKPLTVNHSCEPNMLRVDSTSLETRRLECQFFALEDIRCGDELTIAYEPKVLELENVSARRALLELEHGFFCRCSRCDDESKARDSQPPVGLRKVFAQVDGAGDEWSWETTEKSTVDSEVSNMKRIRLRVRKVPKQTITWLKGVPRRLKNPVKRMQRDRPALIMVPLHDIRDEDGKLLQKVFELKVLNEYIGIQHPQGIDI